MRHKLYMADGSELIATSVEPVKNNAGEGYRVVDEQGRVMFHKGDEITTILKLNGDGDYAPNFKKTTNEKHVEKEIK